MSITRLVFLRHGQTDWNHTHRLQGQADVELDAVGVRQAHAAARALAGRRFAAVYSSDLGRALVTAQTVADDLDLPVSVDARLQEIHVGSWSGKTRAQVEAEMPLYADWYLQGRDFRRSDSGETMAEMVERAMPAIEEILDRHDGQETLVVGHGFLFSKLLQHVLNLSEDSRVIGSLGNGHWSEVAFSEHGTWLVSHNVGALQGDWSTGSVVR
ncbi:MAG: histidine phosphatase family protein [Propionibacteriaceae bacterium]|nr:histidine phosphatase family protein [Propionibacteriaceae bacterium]